MESNKNMEEMKDADRSKILFNFMDYLQTIKKDVGEDHQESLDVALQCIGEVFGLNTSDESQIKQYSIKPQTLPTIMGWGLAGKEKISAALEQLHKKQGDPNDLEVKFSNYIQSVKKKGAFNGVNPGTQEYEERFLKARQKFMEKFGLKPTTTSTSSTSSTSSASKSSFTPNSTPFSSTPSTSTSSNSNTSKDSSIDDLFISKEDKIKLAEKHKVEGNNKLTEKQYSKAVESYTKAITLDPSNAVFYSNRAAALSHLGKHQDAIDDCLKAISLKPDYSKPYGRLGLAYFSLGKYQDAVDQYKKALEFEPNNANLKESLQAAEKKLQEGSNPNPNPMQGMPDLSNLMNNPQMANLMNMFGGGNGGNSGNSGSTGSNPSGTPPFDINAIMNNPMFSQMANQMMSNPAMMNMAQNLMQNPTAVNNMMRSFGIDPSTMGGDQSSGEHNEI